MLSDLGLNYLPRHTQHPSLMPLFLTPDLNGLWMKHYDSVFYVAFCFLHLSPKCKKDVCEENSQIRSTCLNVRV